MHCVDDSTRGDHTTVKLTELGTKALATARITLHEPWWVPVVST